MAVINRNNDPEGLFAGLDKRRGGGAYFYRIPGYNDKVKNLISRYYSAAQVKGAVLAGKLPNPDDGQVSYFLEMLGRDFRVDKFFIGRSLGKWLPALNNDQCVMLTDAVIDALERFKALGKNEAMVKNLYIRLMCWFYYKLSGTLSHIGENEPPKVIYGGKLGRHELYLLTILHRCRCDVILLLYGGEDEYNSFDPQGTLSVRLDLPDMKPYPQGFDIKQLAREDNENKKRARLYGFEPNYRGAANIWLTGNNILEDIKKPPVTRGDDESLFYNAFCRITGVEDKLTYENELYKFYTEIKNSGRRYVLIENSIPMPSTDELVGIDRSEHTSPEGLISAMLKCIKMPPDEQLKRIITKAYIDVLLDEHEKPGMKPQRLSTMATCIACWLNRYGPSLFNSWTMPMVSLFIYLGGCKNGHEAAFLRVLSRVPCDVLVIAPNLNTKCLLEDKTLFELKYAETMSITEFPRDPGTMQLGTAAYHAERELDDALYSGTGLYRDYQYKKANSVILRTMYEEIDILWKQEVRFRPNFSVTGDTVNVPSIFAKISGVKDSQPSKYWKSVQQLITENTLLILEPPLLTPDIPNPMKYNSAAYIRGGRLERQTVLSSRDYPYRYLREETQAYIFDKIDLLISSRIIKGTFENGTEYLIAATLLNLPAQIIRHIQGFDFTKVNPKLIYINTGEKPITVEDAILTSFLSLAGFDVVFFVPTGYQTVEGYFAKPILDEHKIGEYMYDLHVPRFKLPKPNSANKNKPLFGGLFRKGK